MYMPTALNTSTVLVCNTSTEATASCTTQRAMADVGSPLAAVESGSDYGTSLTITRASSDKASAPSGKGEKSSSIMPRHIGVLVENPEFCNNNSTSAKYTLATFVPLAVAEVLDPRYKITNIYFVIAGALQLVPSITLTGGVSTIWINVGVLMVQDMAMMGIQDYARSRSDALTNKLPVERCGANTLAKKAAGDSTAGEAGGISLPAAAVATPTPAADGGDAAASTFFESGTWADVKVGDIVRVRDREAFPADCVLIRACDPEPGQAWVSTKPLDGESDTKLRLSVKQTAALLTSESEQACIDALRGATFQAEAPNDKVNDFTGLLTLKGGEPILITPSNMLLRGCQLRSTSWVYALVVATGRDTKANFGTDAQLVKHSTTLKSLNYDIMVLFCVTLLVALIGAAVNAFYLAGDPDEWWCAPHAYARHAPTLPSPPSTLKLRATPSQLHTATLPAPHVRPPRFTPPPHTHRLAGTSTGPPPPTSRILALRT